jgi:hypothetical protein
MTKIILLLAYLMTTGELRVGNVEFPTMDECAAYATELTNKRLDPGVRDFKAGCHEIKLDPFRGSKPA